MGCKTVREFARLSMGLLALCCAGAPDANVSAEPVLRIETGPDATIPFLSWDTEGGDRARNNLLRSPVCVQALIAGEWRREGAAEREVSPAGVVVCRVQYGNTSRLTWQTTRTGAAMDFVFQGEGIDRVRLVFPFNARMAGTTVFPASWETDGSLRLPAVICAPDFGQVCVSGSRDAAIAGQLTGSRKEHTVDFTIEMPPACTLQFAPAFLPMPEGFADEDLWRAVRRGWFNIWQPSARWGEQGRPFSAPPGILSNNVISDPVSCLIHLYADQAFFTPDAAPGISIAAHVRRTVEYWVNEKMRPSGEVVAYWDYGDMLDANASPLIAAWDYVESTGDVSWLARHIERLERVADYLAGHDVDADGLVECTHSGNYGSLFDPDRSASAWDTINAGHKDAYSNALTYRAWRCLADLEARAGRREPCTRYTRLADRLKERFFPTLFDPATGWIAWWKSEDGELHNLACPMVNALAIEYGLVEPAVAKEILLRLWAKMEDAGFNRFDLGVPLTLVPVRRGDYLQPRPGRPASTICGAPEREDGTDTFGKYLNGGCCVSDAVHFMTALYMAGEQEKGDIILNAMLERQRRGVFPNGGSFQNGIVDAYPQGAEFFDWQGNTCGYEGHLTYSFSFLQAVLLRESAFRARLLRPLIPEPPSSAPQVCPKAPGNPSI
ncbi:MAG: hypothetical protein KA184_19540 [Candidatus Hydrogenedentes bacterium]|nr:hypothetical protein [Candidatus Hydrogenedentota bacterium]